MAELTCLEALATQSSRKLRQNSSRRISMVKPIISQSRISMYQQCHYAHHLRYVERLKKKVPARPLIIGRAVHSILQAEAEGESDIYECLNIDMSKMFDEEKAVYQESIDTTRSIMNEYFNYYREEPIRYIRKNKRSAEHEVTVDFGDFSVIGIIDGFAKQQRMKFLVEHKTASKAWDSKQMWRNLQIAVYIKLAELAGYGKMDGVMFNFILNKTPTKPQVLKSGKLSERAILSLPYTVKSVIHENKLQEKDYTALIQNAYTSRAEYFNRVYIPINGQVIDNIWNDFLMVAREIAAFPLRDKHVGFHCSWCQYEPICSAELTNADVDFVIRNTYEKGGEKS